MNATIVDCGLSVPDLATWDRMPMLEGEIERAVQRAIRAKSLELGAEPLALGGVADHVHFLAGLPATLCVAELMHGIKGASAHLATHELEPNAFFKWQGAYAAFSVSPLHRNKARYYVDHQREHHATNAPTVQWEQRIFKLIRDAREEAPVDTS